MRHGRGAHRGWSAPSWGKRISDIFRSMSLHPWIAGQLGRMQRRLGRSPLVARAAVALRNQCEAVIQAYLSDGSDPEENGEYRFLDLASRGARGFVDVGANLGHWSERFAKNMAKDGVG